MQTDLFLRYDIQSQRFNPNKVLVICTEHVFADIRFVPLAVPLAIVSAVFCGIPQCF